MFNSSLSIFQSNKPYVPLNHTSFQSCVVPILASLSTYGISFCHKLSSPLTYYGPRGSTRSCPLMHKFSVLSIIIVPLSLLLVQNYSYMRNQVLANLGLRMPFLVGTLAPLSTTIVALERGSRKPIPIEL